MWFMSGKKKVEVMLKETVEVFRDNWKMLFGSKFTKDRKVEIFSQKLGKTNKQPHNSRDNVRLQYTFYWAAGTIESLKIDSNVIKENRFDRPGD